MAAWLPFADVLKIRQGYKDEPHALEIKQVKTFFETIDRATCIGIRDYAVYGFMYGLGLRIGEVHTLNLESLDSKKNTLTVTGKGSRRRVLNLSVELGRVLAEYLAIRSHFLNAGKNQALFMSKKGNRLSIRTMEDNFKKIIARSELQAWFKVTCHTLRHCFASHLNDEGVDILVLQSLLGHSTPKSTEIYIHPAMRKVREALENLPGVIYMNHLYESGGVPLKFQSRVKQKSKPMEVITN